MTSQLVRVLVDRVESPAPVLVHALTGFMDAGSAGALAVSHLERNLTHRVVAEWDVDAVFDYRARRPSTIFEADHYASIEMPSLRLLEVKDLTDQSFLLLSGSEPDLGWRTIASDVIELVESLGVRLTVGIHAIPWPAPHTRPTQVTAHATDASLIPGNQPWVGALKVPGSISGLIELSLGQKGHPALGYAAHVPHYLAQSEYMPAARTLIDKLQGVTGLDLDLASLDDPSRQFLEQVDGEIAGQEEFQALVTGLEQQHDLVMRARGAWDSSLADSSPADSVSGTAGSGAAEPDGSPSAMSEEDIAAAVERFLAELDAQGRGES